MKNTLRLSLVLALLCITLLSSNAHAQDGSPEAIVSSTYEAINAGDIEAYVALFAENAVVTAGSWHLLVGKDEIRASAQETFDSNVAFDYKILEADGPKILVWSSHSPPEYSFPLEATEQFVVIDGEIVFNAWNPTEETMALLLGPQIDQHILKGLYDFTVTGNLQDSKGDSASPEFSMTGAIVADGHGTVTGWARTFALGDVAHCDSVEGTYKVTDYGTATVSLHVYREDQQIAIEDLNCVIRADGERLECSVAAITVLGESGAVTVPAIGSAHGRLRLAE